VIGYFLGVAVLAARFVGGLFVGASLCRGAERTSVYGPDMDVRLSTGVQGPVSFGSTVLLPAGSVTWDNRTVQAVLAHEHEHIRNHDGYRLWLALLCRAVFWFNPLAHWLYRRLTILTELTSDAAAAEVIGDRASYLSVLLQIATGTSPMQAVAPMATRSTLPVRVRQLLTDKEPSLTPSTLRKSLLVLGVVLFAAATAACASRPPLVMARVTYAPDLNDYYPASSRRRHEQGDGLVHICIDKRGRLASAHVAHSTGYATLDVQMIKIAKAFRFDPATRGANPVKVCTGLPVRFVLSTG
jgi:bla regulator protein blaR1